MKNPPKPVHLLCLLGCILLSTPKANAQLLKKLQKRAEQAVERKLEQKVEDETEKTMDSILNPNEKPSTEKPTTPTGNSSQTPTQTSEDVISNTNVRSEERRVGKECRSRRSPYE